MSIVRRDFDNIVALTELLALLVEDDTVLVKSLSLSNDRHASTWVSSTSLRGRSQSLIDGRISHELTKLISRSQTLRADAGQVTSLGHVIESTATCSRCIQTRSRKAIAELVGVLAHNITILRLLDEFVFPTLDAISCRFLLQSLEERLVL